MDDAYYWIYPPVYARSRELDTQKTTSSCPQYGWLLEPTSIQVGSLYNLLHILFLRISGTVYWYELLFGSTDLELTGVLS